MYSLICHKFISDHNQMMLMMVLSDTIKVTEQIRVIGSYYRVVAQESINQMILYYQGTNQELKTYLSNLPIINPKFRVGVGVGVGGRSLPITPPMTPNPKGGEVPLGGSWGGFAPPGIIWKIPEGTIISEMALFDQVNDLLYDESVGLIGLTAGGHVTSRGQWTANAKKINYVSGCLVYRSELCHYGIQWSDQSPWPELDFCCQIRHLGKRIISRPVLQAPLTEAWSPIQREQSQAWAQFVERWHQVLEP
jgi:hypothetical protein